MHCILLLLLRVYARSCLRILAAYNVCFNPYRVCTRINENVLLRYHNIIIVLYTYHASLLYRASEYNPPIYSQNYDGGVISRDGLTQQHGITFPRCVIPYTGLDCLQLYILCNRACSQDFFNRMFPYNTWWEDFRHSSLWPPIFILIIIKMKQNHMTTYFIEI